MDSISLSLGAAKVLISVLGAVDAPTGIARAQKGLDGATALRDLAKALFDRKPGLAQQIADDLAAEMTFHHLTEDQRRLIPQMVEAAHLSPAEVMACGRDPVRIAAAMADRHNDPAHRAARQPFCDVLTPLLARRLADKATTDDLRPAYEDAVLTTLGRIAGQVDLLVAQTIATARRLGEQEALVRDLARRYAPGSDGDFDSARLGLEQALEAAERLKRQAALPSNLDAQVKTVMAEVARQNDMAQPKAGMAALENELDRLAQEVAERNQARMALHAGAVEQARVLNDPATAAHHAAQRVRLDGAADLFEALRAEQDAWFSRGRDKGLNFDLMVAIAIAQLAQARAGTPDQRGAALNDLGTALAILGQREVSSDRLEQAVQAYRAALKEWTRDRSPLRWGMAQNNLGNTLAVLGEREGSSERLGQAVQAYRDALTGRTQGLVPLDWATTQNNLGNALSALGRLEGSGERLDQAVQAYRAALTEWTQDRVPLQWALTQNNLGSALQTLGQREGSGERLDQAVQAYRAALTERTQDRVPLDWALTQNNLGNALAVLGQREGSGERLDQAVQAYRAALTERTQDRVPLDWATTQNNLGNALLALGRRERSSERLDQAVQAYRAALTEMTQDRVPLDWATTQNNLGNALAVLGQREGSSERLDQAVQAYRGALTKRTQDRAPLQWAMTTANLAIAQLAIFDLAPGPGLLQAARQAAMGAREVFQASAAQGYLDQLAPLFDAIDSRSA